MKERGSPDWKMGFVVFLVVFVFSMVVLAFENAPRLIRKVLGGDEYGASWEVLLILCLTGALCVASWMCWNVIRVRRKKRDTS